MMFLSKYLFVFHFCGLFIYKKGISAQTKTLNLSITFRNK